MNYQWDKKEYRELLEDICSEYCEKDHYCILKEFLVSLHPSTRMLMQLKCMDKFKYEKSKEAGEDLGWQKTIELWVEEGYAKKFAEEYNETIKFAALYKKVRNGNGDKK